MLGTGGTKKIYNAPLNLLTILDYFNKFFKLCHFVFFFYSMGFKAWLKDQSLSCIKRYFYDPKIKANFNKYNEIWSRPL